MRAPWESCTLCLVASSCHCLHWWPSVFQWYCTNQMRQHHPVVCKGTPQRLQLHVVPKDINTSTWQNKQSNQQGWRPLPNKPTNRESKCSLLCNCIALSCRLCKLWHCACILHPNHMWQTWQLPENKAVQSKYSCKYLFLQDSNTTAKLDTCTSTAASVPTRQQSKYWNHRVWHIHPRNHSFRKIHRLKSSAWHSVVMRSNPACISACTNQQNTQHYPWLQIIACIQCPPTMTAVHDGRASKSRELCLKTLQADPSNRCWGSPQTQH